MKIELTVEEFKEIFGDKKFFKCTQCDFIGWNKEHLLGHISKMH